MLFTDNVSTTKVMKCEIRQIILNSKYSIRGNGIVELSVECCKSLYHHLPGIAEENHE
jgi:hypothetical protein